MGAWKLCWLAFVCLSMMIDSSQAGRKLQSEQQRRLRAYTGNGTDQPRHAPPIKSFLVSDGSWVDCVPIEGQIAAHHPSLKDHVIRMIPPKESSSKPRSSSHPQLFAQEHGGCPDGSIPVLRTKHRYLNKTRSPPTTADFWSGGGYATPEDPDFWSGGGYAAPDPVNPATTPQVTHEYAVTGLPNASGAYSGAHSIFSVNSPTLENNAKDFSLSQIWVIDGRYDDNSLSTIEVGWQKFPSEHVNDQPDAPHLFIYWTNSAYNHSTGVGSCYDLDCPGFVQQSNTWVIGGAMPKYTTLGENATAEYEVEIEVVYYETNWWLYLDGEAIGYWPSSIYINGYMQGSCNQVQWGGEVVFYRDYSVPNHSATAMGSGAFPVAGYPKAAYQRNLSYADATGSSSWINPSPTVLHSERIFENPLCYDIQVQQGNFPDWGTYFFFGGPGGANPGCHY